MSQKRGKLFRKMARLYRVPAREFVRAAEGKSHDDKGDAYRRMRTALAKGVEVQWETAK